MYKINDLLINIDNDKGLLIKKLISLGLLSYEEVVYSLIATGNVKLIIKFQRYVGGYSLDKLERIVIEKGDAYDLLDFASINGCNVKKLAREVIKKGDARVMYLFFVSINNAPQKELIKGIIASNSATYIYFLAIYINKLNIDLNLKKEYINILTKGIISTHNAWYIYCYALNIKSASIKDLSFEMVKLDDASNIYNFIVDVKGPYVDFLIVRLIELNAIDYLIKLVLLKREYSSYILDYIISLNNEEYIYLLMVRTNNEELREKLRIIYENLKEIKHLSI